MSMQTAKARGYNTESGYMGWVDEEQKWMLFSCEADYKEFIS